MNGWMVSECRTLYAKTIATQNVRSASVQQHQQIDDGLRCMMSNDSFAWKFVCCWLLVVVFAVCFSAKGSLGKKRLI